MTKRPNPYSDDNQPQIKIHVGMKEYNNTHEKMKTVFDKTLAILYRGANQKGDDPDNIKTDTPFKNDNARKFKQMFLGKNGTLQSTGTLQEDIAKPCFQCKERLSDIGASCSYCDNPQCILCAITCSSCWNPTCSNCSLSGYGNQNGILCLSCCR